VTLSPNSTTNKCESYSEKCMYILSRHLLLPFIFSVIIKWGFSVFLTMNSYDSLWYSPLFFDDARQKHMSSSYSSDGLFLLNMFGYFFQDWYCDEVMKNMLDSFVSIRLCQTISRGRNWWQFWCNVMIWWIAMRWMHLLFL
jgi:hypothetical protein